MKFVSLQKKETIVRIQSAEIDEFEEKVKE
nr:MAG TPA: hypothetical protein [Caudoviricetes sp.]